MNLSAKILFGLFAGVLFGCVINITLAGSAPTISQYFLSPIGNGFLRLIQFVVVPIVFCSLILGLNSLRGSGHIGRYTSRLLLLYIVSSVVSLVVGVGVAVILQPGFGLNFQGGASVEAQPAQPLLEWLVSILPANPFEALATGNLLQVILSAVLIGIAMQGLGKQRLAFADLVQSVYDISLKILEIILRFVPVGVFALIASVIATQGLGLIARLGIYILGLILAILVMTLVYVLVLLFARAKPVQFFRIFLPAFSLAFGTASSNAALPLILENAKTYGLRSDLRAFAIPLGTALKRDGAAILQGFNAVFVAQLFGVALTPSLVGAIFVSALLVSFSTAGVPGSGIIMMTTVLSAAGLPLEGVALVAGIDRFTDGFRTTLNVIGNTANAALLNRWEEHTTKAETSPNQQP